MLIKLGYYYIIIYRYYIQINNEYSNMYKIQAKIEIFKKIY